jgi:hypothetical protein
MELFLFLSGDEYLPMYIAGGEDRNLKMWRPGAGGVGARAFVQCLLPSSRYSQSSHSKFSVLFSGTVH